MVGSVVGPHVDAARHMALDAKMAITRLSVVNLLMKVVVLGVIELRPMALGAKVVLLFMAFETMAIMAVTATHTMLIHLAHSLFEKQQAYHLD